MKIEQSRYFPDDDTPELWTATVNWDPKARDIIIRIMPPWSRDFTHEIPAPNDIATLEGMLDRLDRVLTNVAENRQPWLS